MPLARPLSPPAALLRVGAFVACWAAGAPVLRAQIADNGLYWLNGAPAMAHHRGPSNRPEALTSPLLVVETGSLGLCLDTTALRSVGLGRPGENPLALQKTALDAALDVAGVRYFASDASIRPEATRGPRRDVADLCTRIVAEGPWLQWVEIARVHFRSVAGVTLPGEGRLELEAWPDALVWRLYAGGVKLPAGSVAHINGTAVSPTLRPGESLLPLAESIWRAPALQSSNASVHTETPADCPVTTEANVSTIDFTSKAWETIVGTPADTETVPRPPLDVPFSVKNEGPEAGIAYLRFFTHAASLPVTGLAAELVTPTGRALGIPVQVTKNWHSSASHLEHEGVWALFAFGLPVAAHATVSARLRLYSGVWQGLPMASAAQLCLIGYGGNQRWHEYALGSWGETSCYDIDGELTGDSFIADVRPLDTYGPSHLMHDWSGNVGGGGLLTIDYQRAWPQPWATVFGWMHPAHRSTMKEVRDQISEGGPALAQGRYSSLTADGSVRVEAEVSLPQTADGVRFFHHIRYTVLRPVHFERLALYELGSDYYLPPPFRQIAYGNDHGEISQSSVVAGGNRDNGPPVPLDGANAWVSLHDAPEGAASTATRGLIIRTWHASIGGKLVEPWLQTYGRTWGKDRRTLAEVVLPPGVTDLVPGDQVEATFEWYVLPRSAAAYYGLNPSFQRALAAAGNTASLVAAEAIRSTRASVTTGRIVSSYPLEVDLVGQASTELEIASAPSALSASFSGLDPSRDWTLSVFRNGAWNPSGNGWQTSLNRTERTTTLVCEPAALPVQYRLESVHR